MSFLGLSNELLLLIAENCITPKDVNALLRTSRRLWSLLTPYLHKLALEDKDGMAPLHWAIVQHHEPLVLLLLRRGVAVNAREAVEAATPLHWGAKHGHEHMVKILLENGADVRVCTLFKETPLHWAAAFGKLGVIRLLLGEAGKEGSYVDMRDGHGGTALDWAARYGYVEVCEYLLEWGADVGVRDELGWTARKSAEESGHVEVAKLLGEAERKRGIMGEGGEVMVPILVV